MRQSVNKPIFFLSSTIFTCSFRRLLCEIPNFFFSIAADGKTKKH